MMHFDKFDQLNKKNSMWAFSIIEVLLLSYKKTNFFDVKILNMNSRTVTNNTTIDVLFPSSFEATSILY